MTGFIFNVLEDLKNNHITINHCVFIVPSKRAGTILKHELSKLYSRTLFAPIITSIETFTQELSQLHLVPNIELLFQFYTAYKDIIPKEKQDSFDNFCKWAQILLQDFNEIDRYLIDQEAVFDYLSAIKDINHWSLEDNKTDVVKNYLQFWKTLHTLYITFTSQLRSKELGYQGMIYREALEHLEDYIQTNAHKKHIFLGFNALNASEERIIQELLANDLAKIYWDIDDAFYTNKYHDAALFLRQYKQQWHHFKNHSFNWVQSNYKKEKNITTYAIPKNVGQAKQIGHILKQLAKTNSTLDNTAVVLADEALLLPVLNSIPENVDRINITMGFPLKLIPLTSLFELLFSMHKKETSNYYYKDVITILSHEYINFLLPYDITSKNIVSIEKNNFIYLNLEQLLEMYPNHHEIITLVFNLWDTPNKAIEACFNLIGLLKTELKKEKRNHLLSLEYLYRFNTLFNELEQLTTQYSHVKDLRTLFNTNKELLSSETLDFHGEPLKGLQIMGMLESRVLDFDTVIIASVNEGILPSGKNNNSFIPFDVKLEYKLPTYKEKDAVYTYHFYRLMQRAKKIHILYNSEIDGFNGTEKSRFITQMEVEGIHEITHKIVTPRIVVNNPTLTSITKTDAIITDLKSIANKGFSPSALTSYIRNPLDFYYQKLLKINVDNEVEETIAANTLGTVVHNTLETFYKPLEGEKLTENLLKDMFSQINTEVQKQFKEVYKEGDLTKGKNLIIFEIAKRYVFNFLKQEIALVKQGHTIEIIAIETSNTFAFSIPELGFPVKLTGKVDRIDRYNGTVRIIDYKTGNVQQNQVEVVDWDAITLDYKKYSKSFQILCYALMLQDSLPNETIEAGIISFKNLQAGFIKFAKKPSPSSRQKESLISSETLLAFQRQLKTLILEICNPEVEFIEKDVS